MRALLRQVHAEVVTVTPDDHDVLVALVSHVPQLASSTLMDVATAHEEEHRALLRLAAAGGPKDAPLSANALLDETFGSDEALTQAEAFVPGARERIADLRKRVKESGERR